MQINRVRLQKLLTERINTVFYLLIMIQRIYAVRQCFNLTLSMLLSLTSGDHMGNVVLNNKLIGARIMHRRKTRGYTQEQLSEKIGYSKNHLSSVERGICVPTTQLIFKICAVLGETPDYYLIGRSNSKTKEIEALVESLPESEQKMVAILLKTYIENRQIV